jgi:gliding motility associated protien GldN
MKKFIYTTLIAAAVSASAVAQNNNLTAQAAIGGGAMADQKPAENAVASGSQEVPVDGFYNYSILGNASPFNYPYINPANVRFYKRIWRDIDLTDPRNQIFATPGSSLIEVIMQGIKDGKISAYAPSDDAFKFKMTSGEAMSKLVDTVLVPIFDNEGNQIDSKMMANDFNAETVTRFRIKEDIFYDKQRGKVETRIIGIAPLKALSIGDTSDSLSMVTGNTPAFWLYFPQCRNVFVTKDVSDPDRNLFDMSMDDIFLQRMFAGTIIRESNATGQRIADYTKNSEEQQKEAQRIEKAIEEYKNKVWTFSKN